MSSPTYPTSSSAFNSVLLAYRPLVRLLKIYGIHPIDSRGRFTKCCCNRPGLWLATFFNILLVLGAFALIFVAELLDPDAVAGEYTTVMAFWAICGCAFVHMVANIGKGELNSELQMKWRIVDKHLGVENDPALRSWGRKMFYFFLLLKFMFIGTSVILVFAQRSAGNPLTILLLTIVCALLVWLNCAVLAPQMCYFFFCRAAQSRFAVLGVAIQRALGTTKINPGMGIGPASTIGEKDISVELEGQRRSYHMLADLTQEISNLFSPMILTGFLLDSGMICTCMYRLIQMWDLTRWSVPLEMLAIVTAILKILAITLLGASVTHTAVDTLQLLPKTSYKDKTRESKYQAQLFALTSGEDEPCFHASGFFDIDRRMFTATVGTVATYFVVLLQFRK